MVVTSYILLLVTTLYAEEGNNTVVSYGGNDYIDAGSGHDHYYIEASGAKIIDDRNGNDSIFISWIDNPGDLQFAQVGGVLYIDITHGTGDSAVNRIAIEKWVDGYGWGEIEILRYEDAAGVIRSANLTELARSDLGLDGDVWQSGPQFMTADEEEATPPLGEIFGEPLPGYPNRLDGSDAATAQRAFMPEDGTGGLALATGESLFPSVLDAPRVPENFFG